MLDTNIYDKIVAQPGMTAILNNLTQAGKIRLLRTYLQEREVAEIPDAEKRGEIGKILTTRVSTHGCVWGGEWGSLWGNGSDNLKLDSITSPSGKHMSDALIATTANGESAILVTEDDRLTKRVRQSVPDQAVQNFAAFSAFIESIV